MAEVQSSLRARFTVALMCLTLGEPCFGNATRRESAETNLVVTATIQ